jgi:hypothetical protein
MRTPLEIAGYRKQRLIKIGAINEGFDYRNTNIIPTSIIEAYRAYVRHVLLGYELFALKSIDVVNAGAHFGGKIKQASRAKVRVHRINAEIGFGCFADKVISEGEYIGEYVGEIRQLGAIERQYEIGFNQGPIVDAGNVGNELRFMNHQPARVLNDGTEKGPNAMVVQALIKDTESIHLAVVAKREIQRGEEVRIQYGSNYFTNSERDTLSYEAYWLHNGKVIKAR